MLSNNKFDIESITKLALKKWGESAQLDQTIEELAELIVEINHKKRNREENDDKLVEELVDSLLMIHQIYYILKSTDPNISMKFNEIWNKKVERVIKKLI